EALSGGNIIHDVGYLESGLMYSFTQLVICAEMIRWFRYYKKEIVVNEETLALDLIMRIAHDEQYLQLDHTFRNFRQHYYPNVFERGNYDGWVEKGSKNLTERATEQVEQLLAGHRPEPLPEKTLKMLKEIRERAVARAKK
ncbi:MAG: trimethylamine methyltransferase, partial [Firmicutes bacterium]|nr:trimethylamine methyltransferase [Bacillota bacterium]